MCNKPRLPLPPQGYPTWLDYAVATMDTRSAYNEQLWLSEPGNNPPCDRQAMQAAVLFELDALRAAAQVPDTYPERLRSGLQDKNQTAE